MQSPNGGYWEKEDPGVGPETEGSLRFIHSNAVEAFAWKDEFPSFGNWVTLEKA